MLRTDFNILSHFKLLNLTSPNNLNESSLHDEGAFSKTTPNIRTLMTDVLAVLQFLPQNKPTEF